jgi:hypothetical protein
MMLHAAYCFTPAEITKWRTLESVCLSGDVGTAKWLVATYELTVTECGELLFFAGGHLRMVQWLVRHCNITRENSYTDILHLFQGACDNDWFSVAQWITAHFGITLADIRGADGAVTVGAFVSACGGGHLPLAQWLAHHFDLTEADARSNGEDYALTWACRNGHWQVVEWLVTHYNITAASINIELMAVVQDVCMRGHLSVAQWLTAHFGLTSADLRAYYKNATLYWACKHGRLPVVAWLVVHFGFTIWDMRIGEALASACENDNLPTVQWLVARFRFTSDELRHASAVAQERSHGDIAAWTCAEACMRGLNQ